MRVIAPSQNTQHRCLHSAPGTLRVRARRVPGHPPEFHGDLRLGHLTIGNLMPQIGTARRLPWFTRSLAYRPDPGLTARCSRPGTSYKHLSSFTSRPGWDGLLVRRAVTCRVYVRKQFLTFVWLSQSEGQSSLDGLSPHEGPGCGPGGLVQVRTADARSTCDRDP